MPFRLRSLRAAVAALGLIFAVGCGQASPSDPAGPLEGVWSLTAVDPGDGSPVIDPSQPGLYIFAAGYYSAVYAPGAEPRVPSAIGFQPTPEEMVAQHESIIVNTGTYEISGSTVTFRPIMAKSPEWIGGQATSQFHIDGDMLTLTEETVIFTDGTAAPTVAGSLILRRVE